MCNRWCLDFAAKALAHLPAQADVLEVGSCNVNGSVREVLAPGAGSYLGVDLAKGPGVDRVLDVADLSEAFSENCFDVVVSTEMLEHCREWQRAVREMWRVLKPGGILLLTTRSPGFPPHGHPDDFWRFTRGDVETIFRDVGEMLLVDHDMTLGWACGIGVTVRKLRAGTSEHDWYTRLLRHNVATAEQPTLHGIPFDQYSRYRMCAAVLTRLSPGGGTVLDCGSGKECLLERFLPQFDITFVDPLLARQLDHPGKTLGSDVFHPALDSRLFDYVVAIDTLEHVPPEHRSEFLDRTASLARLGLIVACPCADAGDALETDRYVNEVYKTAFGLSYPWLSEHFRYGLPSLAEISRQLLGQGWYVEQTQHGHAPWLRELLPFVICGMNAPSLRPAVARLSEHFIRELYPYDDQPPGYRQVVVALRDPPDSPLNLPRFVESLKPEADQRWQEIRKRLLMESCQAARRIADQDQAHLLVRVAASSLRRLVIGPARWSTATLRPFVVRRDRFSNALLTRLQDVVTRLPVSAEAKWQLRRAFFATVGVVFRKTPHYEHYIRERTWRRRKPSIRTSSGHPLCLPLSETPDVVVWSAGLGGSERKRAQHLARALAGNGHHVFLVSDDFVKSPEPGFQQTPIVGPDSLVRVRLNLADPATVASGNLSSVLLEQIRPALGQVLAGSNGRRVISILSHPFWGEAATMLPNSRLVYDWVDASSDSEMTPGNILARIRPLSRADLVTTNSESLFALAREHNQNVALIRDGEGPIDWQEQARQLLRSLARAPEPRVSVVVVTHNNLELTQLCLESVERESDYPRLQLIIVDNASTDDTAAYLREWQRTHPNVRLLLNTENIGFPAATNQGFAVSDGDYLVSLNNDTVVTVGWVRTSLNHLRNDPRIAMVGPVTNNIGNEARVHTDYRRLEDMPRAARARSLQHLGRTFEIHTLAFFCVMIRREVYNQVGPLDESFGIGFFEDDDYCRRVDQLGYRIVCAEDVFVHHHMSAAFDTMSAGTRQELFAQNRKRYEAKWGPWTPPRYRSEGTD